MVYVSGLFCAVGLLFSVLSLQGCGTTPPSSPPVVCEVAAVGGGWSGVYFAYRHLTGSNVPANKICLFEANDRIGGRTYSRSFDVKSSGGIDKFVVDVGAYRFSPDMHLPGDVILKKLNLSTACYEPDCEPANKDFPPPFTFNYTAALRRIVDPVTKMPAGYMSAINTMVEELQQMGAHVARGKKLVDIDPKTGGGATLIFEGGMRADASTVLLNLPRSPMLALPRVQKMGRTRKMFECVKFDQPKALFPDMHFGRSLTKAYAFYDDAWWHNQLNITEGQWPANAFLPVRTTQGIPVGIHWNDGPVICDSPGKGCRGFLEVYYAVENQTFFEDLKKGPTDPSGMVDASMPGGSDKLKKLHEAVMEATWWLFKNRSLNQPTTPPRMLVVGVWDRAGQGYTAPTKVYYSTSMNDTMAKACNVPGLTEQEYRDTVLSPFGQDAKIHVANNDWVAQEVMGFYGDWAEESLLQAERALKVLGVPRPDWLDSAYYNNKVVAFAPKITTEVTV